MIWCPRYQISFCLENSHLIFCILKMLLSAFQNYLIPSIDPPGWCFNLNIKVLRFAASLFFSLLFKEKYAFQRTRLITLSILSIDCSLWDVREGVRILFSEGLEYIFPIFQCAAMRICWFIKGGYIFFSCFNVRRSALLICWGRAVCRWVMCRVADMLGPFRAVGRLMGRFQRRELNLRPPRLPRFIMLGSFSDTLLMVSILDMIVICSRFCGPERVKDLTKQNMNSRIEINKNYIFYNFKFQVSGLQNRKTFLSFLSPLWNIDIMKSNDPYEILSKFETFLLYYRVIELI